MTAAAGPCAFLVIPVKPAVGAKQRLASELPGEARQLVSRALAARMVRCAAEGWDPSHVVVVSDDADTLQLCARMGLAAVGDDGGGQSHAVRLGQRWCLERGAHSLATVAADLPLVEPSDLRHLQQVLVALPPKSLRVIPDRAGSGSNGILVNPAEADPFAFGPDSLRLHRLAAERLGLGFGLLELPHLAWDVDRPEDLVPTQPELARPPHPVVGWAGEVAALRRRRASRQGLPDHED
jgi:2-phospho-L-lactate/phosphoenolpyruvate guanylyltransferase